MREPTDLGPERVLIEPGPGADASAGPATPAGWDEVEQVLRTTVERVEAVRVPSGGTDPARTEWRLRASTTDGPVDAVLVVVPARSPEAVGYGSGLLGALPGNGLRAPRLRALVERADGSRALWLEAVDGPSIASSDAARQVTAAEDLGRLQGAYVAGAARLPELPGLAHDQVVRTVESRGAAFDDFRPFSATAQQRQVVPAATLRAAERVWRERSWHLRRLATLPRTLNHHALTAHRMVDATGSGRDGSTVAHDWHTCGAGGLGHDLATWVMEAALDGTIPAADLAATHEALLGGYRAGLGEAGASLSEAEVRFAVAAHATVAYAWVPAVLLGALGDDPPTAGALDGRLTGPTRDAAIAAWAAAAAHWYELSRFAAEHAAARPADA